MYGNDRNSREIFLVAREEVKDTCKGVKKTSLISPWREVSFFLRNM